MRNLFFLIAATSSIACSPLQGEWSGTCSANGARDLTLSNLSGFSGNMEGAEQPSEWAAVRGEAVISPALGQTETGSATLHMCDEFYAPCTYTDGGSTMEVEANYVYGTITPTDDDEPVMRLIGEMFDDDGPEIEGNCYNLVQGGAGVLTLNR